MAFIIDGTTGIATVDGSVSAPSQRGQDNNSGISYAADTIKFSTNGVERMAITNTGVSGTGVGGKILQFKSTTKKDTASFSVASDTVYHYTDTSLRVTITPTSASNTLYIMGEVTLGRDLLNRVFVVLGKDGSTLATANGDAGGSRTSCASVATNNDTNMPFSIPFHIEIPAENTSERYYNLGFHHGSSSSRTLYLNRSSGDADDYYQPRTISTISVMELAA